ncbi:Adenylate cyclase type 3 [Cichlidogyrus casuarinus]|uniref:adenylate cyclase n=1 Tax=Cichlidogyrus casuarinus TaxID=1844966 RepID=A0ABD2PN64_9PLAT
MPFVKDYNASLRRVMTKTNIFDFKPLFVRNQSFFDTVANGLTTCSALFGFSSELMEKFYNVTKRTSDIRRLRFQVEINLLLAMSASIEQILVAKHIDLYSNVMLLLPFIICSFLLFRIRNNSRTITVEYVSIILAVLNVLITYNVHLKKGHINQWLHRYNFILLTSTIIISPMRIGHCLILGGLLVMMSERIRLMASRIDPIPSKYCKNEASDTGPICLEETHNNLYFVFALYIRISFEMRNRAAFVRTLQTVQAKAKLETNLKMEQRWIEAIMPRIVCTEYLEFLNSTKFLVDHYPMYSRQFDNVSILFSDLVGFTSMSSTKTASQVVSLYQFTSSQN